MNDVENAVLAFPDVDFDIVNAEIDTEFRCCKGILRSQMICYSVCDDLQVASLKQRGREQQDRGKDR